MFSCDDITLENNRVILEKMKEQERKQKELSDTSLFKIDEIARVCGSSQHIFDFLDTPSISRTHTRIDSISLTNALVRVCSIEMLLNKKGVLEKFYVVEILSSQLIYPLSENLLSKVDT